MTKPNKPQWEQEFNRLFDINKGVKFPQVFENGKYTDVVPVAAVREFITDQIAKAEKRGYEKAHDEMLNPEYYLLKRLYNEPKED